MKSGRMRSTGVGGPSQHDWHPHEKETFGQEAPTQEELRVKMQGRLG